MTRKDYVLIAKTIAAVRNDCYQPESLGILDILAQELATNLKVDNSKFDREKFIAACKGE